ncbi:LysR family transcriptional regulator [Paraburkholderia sp. Ac-20340]|uniref:LysR substrate-binding domain-containing protein n=1 Tax=Paraburkholderia sp. Ac-20340 TaxID=2703888 RepID=UPI00197FA6F0|nr:LysR substrate-binding domain-containing protein [Paraburkholderia sp. Ac-20340]MBN3854120.1 LysR family transcriptional regulator [Paraburkholderia sp. Ac-20340]
MKFHQFRALVAMADTGSIRAAARALGISPAAATKAVRELEAEQQIALVTRNANGIAFTEAGQALLVHARAVVHQLARAQDELDARRGSGGGKLSIGVTPWLALSFLPDAVTRFRARMPGMQLEFYEGLLNIVMPRLRDGTLDFSLGKPGLASLHAEFSQTPIFATESAVVVRKGHPLELAHSLKALQDCEWLLNWDPASKEMVTDDVFRRHGLPLPRTVHLAHSFIVAMGLIMNTDMVSIFPWPLVETRFARENLRALTLQEEVDRTVVSVVARRGVPLSAAAECFLDCLKDAIRAGEASQDPERRRLYHSLELLI